MFIIFFICFFISRFHLFACFVAVAAVVGFCHLHFCLKKKFALLYSVHLFFWKRLIPLCHHVWIWNINLQIVFKLYTNFEVWLVFSTRFVTNNKFNGKPYLHIYFNEAKRNCLKQKIGSHIQIYHLLYYQSFSSTSLKFWRHFPFSANFTFFFFHPHIRLFCLRNLETMGEAHSAFGKI